MSDLAVLALEVCGILFAIGILWYTLRRPRPPQDMSPPRLHSSSYYDLDDDMTRTSPHPTPTRLIQDMKISGIGPGHPDWPPLEGFDRGAAAYASMHHDAIHSESGTFQDRVHAVWGLVASGATTLPYAQQMLAQGNSEERADGAAIMGCLAELHPQLIADMVRALKTETDLEVRDTLVETLGDLRHPAAASTLAAITLDSGEDPDTRHGAACALGRVVGRRFDKADDPIAAATHWWDVHGHKLPWT